MRGVAELQDPIVCEQSAALPEDWDDLVLAAEGAEYTHTAHWLASARLHYPGAELVVLSVRREGRLVAGLAAVVRRVGRLRRLDSGLEGTTGGPLLHGDLDMMAQRRLFLDLVRRFQALRRGPLSALGMALNAGAEEAFGPLLAGERRWRRHDAPTAVVSLAGGIDDVEKNKLVMNKRNERNRGLRRGAEVFATRDPQWLEPYYRLYLQAARHWKVEPVPASFLRALLAGPGDGRGAGDVFFTCVKVGRQVIGGHVNLHLGDRVFAWNGVTDPEFARTHFPATLCFWGDMVEACRRGALWLDFGASGVASSLLTFKKYFGATMQQRGYYTSESDVLRLARWLRGRYANLGDRPSRWHDTVRRRS